jgi:hypothetical protein
MGRNRITTALLAFAAGSILTASLMHVAEVRAQNNRFFELNIYHALPGKVPALEKRFSSASQLQAKHGLNVLGYWVSEGAPAFADTFVYLVAHPSREEADRKWNEFHADPAFQEYVKSENADKLIDHVDKIWMRPADYSALH